MVWVHINSVATLKIASAPIARGKHKLRVEYYDLVGYAELRVEVVKRSR